jgi:hypothetical protein
MCRANELGDEGVEAGELVLMKDFARGTLVLVDVVLCVLWRTIISVKPVLIMVVEADQSGACLRAERSANQRRLRSEVR